MLASKYNITVEAGATYRKKITWKTANRAAVNLTGASARMHIRKSVSDSTILVSLTTDNGGLVLGGVLGTIEIVILDNQTDTLVNGVYDIEIVHPLGANQTRNDVTRLLYGTVTVLPSVTR
jgi:hypothetical protein